MSGDGAPPRPFGGLPERGDGGAGWVAQPDMPPGVLLGAGLLALLLGVGVVSSLRAGDVRTAVIVLLVGAGFAGVLRGRERRDFAPRLYAEPTDPIAPPERGTRTGVLLPARPQRWEALGGLALLGLLVVGFAVFWGVDSLRDGRPGLAAVALLPLLLGLLLVVAAVSGAVVRRAPRRGLLLRPNAIVVRTELRPVTLPWETVTRVRAHWTVSGNRNRGSAQATNWLTFETIELLPPEQRTGASRLARTDAPTLDVGGLGLDPDTVLEVCELYLRHPERRAELDTDLGVRTIASWESPR